MMKGAEGPGKEKKKQKKTKKTERNGRQVGLIIAQRFYFKGKV